MKLKIDQSLCIGCGVCYINCPQVFEIFQGKAQIRERYSEYDNDVPEIKETFDAIFDCPVEAIKEIKD